MSLVTLEQTSPNRYQVLRLLGGGGKKCAFFARDTLLDLGQEGDAP